jgi:NAD-dependent SIR2 family protein deacetylase
MFSRILTQKSILTYSEQIGKVRRALHEADAVVIGAGAGLSTSAGLTYSGPRFQEHFGDFIQKYKIQDMYSGGFYPFETLEEHWAWWSRQIMINRYEKAPKPVYDELLKLVHDKDYFVLTTNVDHQFQLAGFDKERLFYTQGDYGLWQCSEPCCQKTWDNEETVRRMVAEQRDMRVPTELVPHCPVCGKPMTMNLRCDNTFVQDKGWYAACSRYEDFLRRHEGANVVYLELGVGGNTPVIIKYPFWKMTYQNANVFYVCINLSESYCPKEIQTRAVCINGDVGTALQELCL